MTRGAFTSSVTSAEQLLKKISLFKSKGVKDLGLTSDEFKNISLKGNYFDTYQAAIRNLDYDILLNDDSFLQFSFTELKNTIEREGRSINFDYKSNRMLNFLKYD